MTVYTRLILRGLALVATLLVLPGCFEITNRMTLNDDSSGEFRMSMGIELNQMADFVVQSGMAHTREEAIEGLKLKLAENEDGGFPPPPADALPAGLRWVAGGSKLEGERMEIQVTLGFLDLSVLREPMESTPTGPVPVGKDGLVGDLRLTGVGKKKVRLAGVPMMNLGADKQTVGALEALKLNFELVAPEWKIKEHDAHQRDGEVLRWSWTAEEAMAKPEISVLFKK